MSSCEPSRGRPNSSRSRPAQRSTPRVTPRSTPLSSQHPSRRPSPVRAGPSDVPIGSDIPNDSAPPVNCIQVRSYFSPCNQMVPIPAEFNLAKSRRHITRVLGESRSINTEAESVIFSSVFKGFGSMTLEEPSTIGHLESSSTQGTLLALVPGEDLDALSAPKLVSKLERSGGEDKILAAVDAMMGRMQTMEIEAARVADKMLALEVELEQERQLKEDSVAELRAYTIAHGIALEEALLRNDATHLNRIRFRDVLNQFQAELANATGVARGKPERHSGDWRRALDIVGDLTTTRCIHAKKLLSMCATSGRYQSLCLSDPAMDLLCVKKSSIRDDGNKVAHPNLDADELLELLQVTPHILDSRTKEGLDVVINLLVQPL